MQCSVLNLHGSSADMHQLDKLAYPLHVSHVRTQYWYLPVAVVLHNIFVCTCYSYRHRLGDYGRRVDDMSLLINPIVRQPTQGFAYKRPVA
jgi:hypothetical protein